MTEKSDEIQGIGEIRRRLDIIENNVEKNTDQIANIREGNIQQRITIEQLNEERKESKKTNEKIFDILDLFKTEFVEIKQEMIYNKEFRVESAKEILEIRNEQTVIRGDVDSLKNSPARQALASKLNFNRQLISLAIGVVLTIVTGIFLHVVFLWF